MSPLRLCPACSRHVHADDTRCPFCEGVLDAAGPPPPTPGARLGRTARIAFGAAIATSLSVTACGGDAADSGDASADTGGGGDSAAKDARGDGSQDATGGEEAGNDAGDDGSPQGDASDAGTEEDAEDDGPVIVPPYGAPPPPPDEG